MVAARIATAKGDIHSREYHQLFSALLEGDRPIQMPLQIHKDHKTHGTQAKHCYFSVLSQAVQYNSLIPWTYHLLVV